MMKLLSTKFRQDMSEDSKYEFEVPVSPIQHSI